MLFQKVLTKQPVMHSPTSKSPMWKQCWQDGWSRWVMWLTGKSCCNPSLYLTFQQGTYTEKQQRFSLPPPPLSLSRHIIPMNEFNTFICYLCSYRSVYQSSLNGKPMEIQIKYKSLKFKIPLKSNFPTI